jgi:hypothetical protein
VSHAFIRDNGPSYVVAPELREKLRAELVALRRDRPEGFKARTQAICDALCFYRFEIGHVVGGLFNSIKGEGDTLQSAFDDAARKA